MTNGVYTVYDPATGVFAERIIGDDPPEDRPFMHGDFPFDEYLVVDGKPVRTPEWGVELAPNRISGIPAGTSGYLVTRPGEVFVINDGVLEFDLVKGQTALVRLQPPCCAPKEIEVYP